MHRILIVEDDVNLLNLYQEVLGNEGYTVDRAEDGREALQQLEAHKPDLVILDLMLPYIDGFEVLRQIKQSPVTKDTQVIVFTNLDSEIQKEKVLKLGANKFLIKVGNDPSELINEVKDSLGD